MKQKRVCTIMLRGKYYVEVLDAADMGECWLFLGDGMGWTDDIICDALGISVDSLTDMKALELASVKYNEGNFDEGKVLTIYNVDTDQTEYTAK